MTEPTVKFIALHGLHDDEGRVDRCELAGDAGKLREESPRPEARDTYRPGPMREDWLGRGSAIDRPRESLCTSLASSIGISRSDLLAFARREAMQ